MLSRHGAWVRVCSDPFVPQTVWQACCLRDFPVPCNRPSTPAVAVMGEGWGQEVRAVASALRQLGLVAASEEAYTNVINANVATHLAALATDSYDRQILGQAHRWENK
jgi:hypothetical protein